MERLVTSKPKVPPCGNDGEIMWCYCGKCEPKDYELPKDLQEMIAIKAVKDYEQPKK